MWRGSASFILEEQHNAAASPDILSLSPPQTTASTMADTLGNPSTKVSAYYQTRAAHHGVVTSDWLAQAQAAVGQHPPESDTGSVSSTAADPGSGKPFSVIDEFNNWRKQPDLAEAVAAIRALAAVIRSSEGTTMMELEIELKKASDSLKIDYSLQLYGS